MEDAAGGIVTITADRCPAGKGDVIVSCINLGHIGTPVGLHVNCHIEALLCQQISDNIQVLLICRLAQQRKGNRFQFHIGTLTLHICLSLDIAPKKGKSHKQAEY